MNVQQGNREEPAWSAGYVESLEILWEDACVVAISKPSGFLVHRSGQARDRCTCLNLLRDQVGHHVYPLHRLDRKTTGVVLFAREPEAARLFGELFASHRMRKVYWAVVRGWVDGELRLDDDLKDPETGEPRSAVTCARSLGQVELPVPVGKWPTARYSLVEARPETGRWHQVRRHLRSAAHPIIGDTTHGEGRQNRLFREQLNSHRMLLHARTIAFEHPVTGETVEIEAPLDAEFAGLCARFGWPGGDEVPPCGE